MPLPHSLDLSAVVEEPHTLCSSPNGRYDLGPVTHTMWALAQRLKTDLGCSKVQMGPELALPELTTGVPKHLLCARAPNTASLFLSPASPEAGSLPTTAPYRHRRPLDAGFLTLGCGHR